MIAVTENGVKKPRIGYQSSSVATI